MKTGFFLGTLATLATYKLWVIGPGRPLLWLSSFSVDALLWALLWLCALALERTEARVAALASWCVFYPGLVVSFFINFAHTSFFEAAARRRLSLLDINFGQVGFFFENVLPWHGWVWLLVLMLVIGITAARMRHSAFPRSLKRSLAIVSVHAACVVTLLSTTPDVPSPSVDIARDLRELWSHSRIRFDASTPAAGAVSVLDKSAFRPAQLTTRFNKIVIIVMETMTSAALEQEMAKLSEASVLRELVRNGHGYTRYYTSNQDSRTGMLGMLSSRVIPYEAYTEEGRDRYMHLSKLPSLADLFHGYGYETAFAVSQEGLEIVVSDLPWQKIISLCAQDVNEHKKSSLCFNPYEFENGCEDKVLLPRVVDFLVAHERAFVYQEMIWGHASEYNKASGKSNAEYYAEYLEALRGELRKHGMLDETLLVLTADHGFRDKTLLLEPGVYQVPMFFYATGSTPRREAGLYSHIDFKDLLLHELDPGLSLPASNPFVHVVGPTGTALRAVIDASGGFLAYKARGFANYALAERRMDQAASAAQLKLFDDYRRHFQRTETLR